MEASPLTQQSRPRSFQPKIDSLYEQLLGNYEHEEPDFSDRFWTEFFLLKPDKASLQRRLENLDVDDLLHIQGQTQLLFRQAVNRLRSGNETLVEFALDTLTVFLGVVLAKRYTNPSSEIITVLAGLDEVDVVFLDFANGVENIVRSGGSEVADDRQYIQETESPARVLEPFLLLGLLANYNKFEFRNPYRLKLEDFVNEVAIQKIIRGFGAICSQSRDQYVAVQDDIGEGWTWSSTLKYIGLGVLAPSRSSTPTRNTEETKDQFAELPDSDASILLAAYDFINTNKLFCYNFVSQVGESKSESPFSAFLSLTSYILNHAYRSPRATLYGLLSLTALRILVEDQTACAKIFDPNLAISVRFCRQRQPFLPSSPKPRPAAAAILDIALDAINHNLRRRLDIPLYTACINTLHRLLSYLVMTRTRLPYHWPLLWQTLLSLLRFLTSYASSLTQEPNLPALIDSFLATLSLAVCCGDSFLPDTTVYDDLFYKLVENAHLLPRFKTAFKHLARPGSSTTTTLPPTNTITTTTNPNAATSPLALVDSLMAIAGHFEKMMEEEKGKGKVLSPKDVMGVVRRG
ncbi:MAG: hypothetical protein Q9212_007477, partial [Teloschistes hypoglaucus]